MGFGGGPEALANSRRDLAANFWFFSIFLGPQKPPNRYKIKKMTLLFLMPFFDTFKNRFFQILASILEGFWGSLGVPKRHQNDISQKWWKRYHSLSKCKVLLSWEAPKSLKKSLIFYIFSKRYKSSLRSSIFKNFGSHLGARFSMIFAPEAFWKRCKFRGEISNSWNTKKTRFYKPGWQMNGKRV